MKKSPNLKPKKQRRKRKNKSIHVKDEPEFKPSHIVPGYRMMRRPKPTPTEQEKPQSRKKIILERIERFEYNPNLGFIKTLEENMRIFPDELDEDEDEDYSINVPWLNDDNQLKDQVKQQQQQQQQIPPRQEDEIITPTVPNRFRELFNNNNNNRMTVKTIQNTVINNAIKESLIDEEQRKIQEFYFFQRTKN